MELVGKLFGFRPPFKHDTIDWMTKKLWYSDVSKARKVLKYVPKFSLDEGIKKTVDYYKKKGYL
ncbi:MAG TPA: NAD(P)-dependent oxidoreductase [Candidatus Pacearchaeota archaeon]|nr:NAD(P)-dependent oxidoreductase [Candidatus Pacearchaeota archaeon]